MGNIPTISIELTLPGQTAPAAFKNLEIKDRVIELPVFLVFLSHAKEDVAVAAELSERLLQDGFMTMVRRKRSFAGEIIGSRKFKTESVAPTIA